MARWKSCSGCMCEGKLCCSILYCCHSPSVNFKDQQVYHNTPTPATTTPHPEQIDCLQPYTTLKRCCSYSLVVQHPLWYMSKTESLDPWVATDPPKAIHMHS